MERSTGQTRTFPRISIAQPLIIPQLHLPRLMPNLEAYLTRLTAEPLAAGAPGMAPNCGNIAMLCGLLVEGGGLFSRDR